MTDLIVPKSRDIIESMLNTAFRPKWNQESIKLPLDYPCQVYPRVSTKKQMENISAVMQQDKNLAIQSGWLDTPGNIIMDTQDLGLSGQLRMDQRAAFLQMIRRIMDGIIKAVVASQVDRLFRDGWGAEYSKFMKICFEYGVVVVTPDFVFDFSRDEHTEKFRRLCEEAWSYMQHQIYERALLAQDVVGLSGRWTGGYLPAGLYVDNREKIDGVKNENYLKIFPFEPWREAANWVYQRFSMNGGNVNGLLREISKKPYLFPAINRKDIPEGAFFKIACPPVRESGEDGRERIIGYTITTHKGLKQFLQQPLLAGYWVYKDILVRPDNHAAVVDPITFLYAFNKLSPVLLSGEPNPAYKDSSYDTPPCRDHQAILCNVIESADSDYKIYSRHKGGGHVVYGFRPKRGIGNPADNTNERNQIPAKEIDETFLQHFVVKLQESDFSDFIEQGEEEEKAIQRQHMKDIKVQIAAAEAAMRDIEANIEHYTNFTLAKAANKRYTALGEDLARLRSELDDTSLMRTKAQQRRTYKKLIQEVGECWDEVVELEEVPVMVRSFVDKVVLAILSPRFYTLTIHWSDPEWGVEKAVCIRRHHTSVEWSLEEDEILRQCYSAMSRMEVLQRLPDRTWKTIIFRATQLRVRRQVRENDAKSPTLICWSDWQMLQRCSISQEEFLNGTFCPKFRPGYHKFASDRFRP